MTRKRDHACQGVMRTPWLLASATALLLVIGAGCFNTTSMGSYHGSLAVGLEEVTTHTLRPGVWDWEVAYEHDARRTTGEIQVFLDEGDGKRTLGTTSIGATTGKTSGTVDVTARADIRVMLEVSTTQGGDITVDWDFNRR